MQPKYATCEGEINNFKEFVFDDQSDDILTFNLDINNFVSSGLDNFG